MPRSLSPLQLIKTVEKAYLLHAASGTAGSTTTDGAITAGDSDVDVTAETNFDDTDWFLLNGSGGLETNVVSGTPTSGNIVTKYKFKFSHDIGATVTEAARIDLGYIEQSGLSLTTQKSTTPVEAANAETPLVFIEGTTQFSASWSMLSFSGPQLLASYGFIDNETGAGTAADPYTVAYGQTSTKFGITVFQLAGELHDGSSYLWDLLNCRFQPSGAVQINRQTPAAIPFGVTFTGGNLKVWS